MTTDIHSVMEAIRGHVADGDASEANRCAIGHPLAIEYLRQHGVPVVESVKSYRGQDILFNRHSVSGIESRFIGNAVLEVRVGPVQDELVFVTDSGPVALRTDADCCSETWFADIVGVRWLLGERVTDIQQIPMTDAQMAEIEADGRTRQEFDHVYGLRLRTRRGVCDIIYRNSSNGYYGGSCHVYDGHLDFSSWPKIEEDWSA